MNRLIAGYGPTAKFLHWLIVAMLVVQYVVAWTMAIEGGETTSGANRVHDLHASLGISIFALALLRLIWRQTHRVPDYPDLPKWQHYSARITHAILYALIVTMPMLGILALSGETAAFELYGILPVPLPVVPDALVEFSEEAHEMLGAVLLTVIGVHVVAAIYHFAIVGDTVMQRMLPRRTRRS